MPFLSHVSSNISLQAALLPTTCECPHLSNFIPTPWVRVHYSVEISLISPPPPASPEVWYLPTMCSPMWIYSLLSRVITSILYHHPMQVSLSTHLDSHTQWKNSLSGDIFLILFMISFSMPSSLPYAGISFSGHSNTDASIGLTPPHLIWAPNPMLVYLIICSLVHCACHPHIPLAMTSHTDYSPDPYGYPTLWLVDWIFCVCMWREWEMEGKEEEQSIAFKHRQDDFLLPLSFLSCNRRFF